MTNDDTTHDHDHECRHCSGLCAGRAARCPYCKRWLRRDAADWAGLRRMDGVGQPSPQAFTTG